jgi:hypothetical protein
LDPALRKGIHGQGCTVGAALMAKAPELLAEPPKIEPVDVLAAKLGQ